MSKKIKQKTGKKPKGKGKRKRSVNKKDYQPQTVETYSDDETYEIENIKSIRYHVP
jgi:outer membrane lipoprotein-sorting protein